ncbi:MAG TPA: hypothetical protein VND64_08030 [Pirellulales bacterium]|nr:hypothetical protein [Pirellulales bacterium]
MLNPFHIAPQCRGQSRHFALRAVSAAVLAAVAATSPAGAAEQVTVRLRSGRTFTGAVDFRTNQDRLWLRFDGGSTMVLRSIDWNAVVSSRRGNMRLTPAELRESAAELGSSRPQLVSPPVVPRGDLGDELATADDPAAHGARRVEFIRSLCIDATLANWDGDVESDGILLRVAPLDADGYILPVSGTLEIDLFGDQNLSPTRGQDYGLLAHWVEPLAIDDVGPNGAFYQLPFQGVHPDFQYDVSPYAMLHARLSVPGQGTFDATTGAMRIRLYNGVRDRLQQSTGTRFFPNERTGIGRSEFPLSLP